MNFCPQIPPTIAHISQLCVNSPVRSEIRQNPPILTAVWIHTPEPEVSKWALSLGPKPAFLHVKTSNDFNVSSMHVSPVGLDPVGV